VKLLDNVIRYWRVKIALRHVPHDLKSAFDIGCDDGYLLDKLPASVTFKEGIDPRLVVDDISSNRKLIKGFFPEAIKDHQLKGAYDVIFGLAVFEHFSEDALEASALTIREMLSKNGRLIVTVPHPFVDRILDILLFFRLIDGQATEEHHGFDPDDLIKYFSNTLKLVKHEKFQFGLNNIFVFER
jgi:2-polyprenyl-3-methyl-5-hydroxy-6-metoxy-1,4-benzoquinol methylase